MTVCFILFVWPTPHGYTGSYIHDEPYPQRFKCLSLLTCYVFCSVRDWVQGHLIHSTYSVWCRRMCANMKSDLYCPPSYRVLPNGSISYNFSSLDQAIAMLHSNGLKYVQDLWQHCMYDSDLYLSLDQGLRSWETLLPFFLIWRTSMYEATSTLCSAVWAYTALCHNAWEMNKCRAIESILKVVWPFQSCRPQKGFFTLGQLAIQDTYLPARTSWTCSRPYSKYHGVLTWGNFIVYRSTRLKWHVTSMPLSLIVFAVTDNNVLPFGFLQVVQQLETNDSADTTSLVSSCCNFPILSFQLWYNLKKPKGGNVVINSKYFEG